MTKKIMFLLTASVLSIGIMTGCSGNSGNTQADDNNNVITQTENQNVADDNADDGSAATTAAGSVTDDNADDGSAATTAAANSGTDSKYISEEEASSIALAQVDGATEDELRINKDNDDNRNIYEVSILHDGVEYDFEIDAQTGDILSQSSGRDDDDDWDDGQSGSQNNNQNNSGLISEKKASKIALGQVDGATESDLRIHQDTDDGRTVYEGSIIYNEMEYEFEIDAQSGDIIDWSSESVYDD